MIEFPNKKYKIIYADPPWSYDDPSKNRGGAVRHYPTMSIDDICNLPVKDIADDDCILFLWTTFPKLIETIPLFEAWGFTYKTNGFTWIKKNKVSTDTNFWGMGRWTRSNAEICLIGVKGKPKRLSAGVHSVIESPIERHSKKPDIVRKKIIELVGDLPRIELFARNKSDGWDTWGNES
jgi:N6-adenosine-specific RNA methylase IME4